MNKKLHLFALIKSMTKSEKRYFKLFNSTFEGKNKTNLKLFNAIDKQKNYDEKALKEKFADELFVKHFAVAKSNLFNSILKSLRFLDENSSERKKISQYNTNFRILIDKGLMDIAKVQLDKGMKLANEYDVIEDKLLIAGRYNALNAYFEFRNNKNVDIQDFFAKPLEYLNELNERYKYKYIGHQIDFLVLQNSMRQKKTQAEIIRILNLPEMQDDVKPLSFKGTHTKFHILLSCYVGQKNYGNALPISKKLLDLSLNQPNCREIEPFNILNNYNNYLHAAVRVAPHEKVKEIMQAYITEMQNLNKIKLVDIADRLFEAQYFYELEYYILNNKFDEAIAIMPNIENVFAEIEDEISSYLYSHFTYNFAYLYFMNGNFLRSQEYVVKLTNSSKLKTRTDYVAAINILKLFIHFELNNIEHLSYEFKNVKELLKRKEYLFDFEKHAIQLIQKLTTKHKPAERKKIYEEHKGIFENLFTKIENRDAFEKFDILHWVNKKLQNLADIPTNKLLLELENTK